MKKRNFTIWLSISAVVLFVVFCIAMNSYMGTPKSDKETALPLFGSLGAAIVSLVLHYQVSQNSYGTLGGLLTMAKVLDIIFIVVDCIAIIFWLITFLFSLSSRIQF